MRRMYMLSGMLGTLLLLCSVGPPGNVAVGQDKKEAVKLPATAPPAIWGVSAWDEDKGVLVLERQRPRAVMTPFTTGDEPKKDDPPKGRPSRAVNQFVEKTQINFADLKVATAGGKEIADADRKSKLVPGTIVLFQDGKEIDKAFLAIFKDDVPVVTKAVKKK